MPFSYFLGDFGDTQALLSRYVEPFLTKQQKFEIEQLQHVSSLLAAHGTTRGRGVH